MDKNKKKLPQRKKLAAVFVSFTILLVGGVSLSRSMSLDYYTVLSTLQKLTPACLALGGLGWVIGMILDKPRRRQRVDYNSLFLHDVMKSNISTDETSDATETTEQTEASEAIIPTETEENKEKEAQF
ncbi:MAG: hypothetical protein PHC64_05295 [Candidatus Gastranaerophilales bacterium]|nr:hypothetical protein [Candidatus Gastranaerophilales bacterium]